MGNLNCFSTDKFYNDSKYQSNSSHATHYEHCNGEYSDRMKTNGVNVDSDYFSYYQQNANYQPFVSQMALLPPSVQAMDSYKLSVDQFKRTNQSSDNTIDINQSECDKDMSDEVTGAFMSDWFAREEADLNYNLNELQKCDSKSESDTEKVTKKHTIKKEPIIDNESDSSSESGMCDLENMTKNDDKCDMTMGFSTKKNGFCCYTAYIMCNNSGEWDNFLKKTARIMTGLQRQFQCKIRFSDKICFHRGNSVRLLQIIGANKGNIIRCKVALPQTMMKLLITPLSGSSEVEEYSRECNRNRDALRKK